MITDEKTADKWLDGLDEVLKKVQEKQAQENKSAIQYSIDETGLSAEKKAAYDEYVQNALAGKGNNEQSYIQLAPVSSRLVEDLKSQGADVEGMHHIVKDNDIRHMRNRHGILVEGKYGITIGDLQAIPYITEQYTEVKPRFKNGKLYGIVYVLDHVDTTYYVEGAVSGNMLEGKQMIKAPLGTVPQEYWTEFGKKKHLWRTR